MCPSLMFPVPMENASDEENEKDFMEITTSKSAKAKSRSERQEELRQMMDDEGNEVPIFFNACY